MSKQVHFVVTVDLDTKEWWVDDDGFSSRFRDGEGTWDTEKQEWSETEWDDNIAALNILFPVASQASPTQTNKENTQ